jgi:hypothetical protein
VRMARPGSEPCQRTSFLYLRSVTLSLSIVCNVHSVCDTPCARGPHAAPRDRGRGAPSAADGTWERVSVVS